MCIDCRTHPTGLGEPGTKEPANDYELQQNWT